MLRRGSTERAHTQVAEGEAAEVPRWRPRVGAETEALARATTRVYGRTKQPRPLTESPARRRDPLESTPMPTLGWKGPVIECSTGPCPEGGWPCTAADL